MLVRVGTSHQNCWSWYDIRLLLLKLHYSYHFFPRFSLVYFFRGYFVWFLLLLLLLWFWGGFEFFGGVFWVFGFFFLVWFWLVSLVFLFVFCFVGFCCGFFVGYFCLFVKLLLFWFCCCCCRLGGCVKFYFPSDDVWSDWNLHPDFYETKCSVLFLLLLKTWYGGLGPLRSMRNSAQTDITWQEKAWEKGKVQ